MEIKHRRFCLLSVPDTTVNNEIAFCEIFPLSVPSSYDIFLSTLHPLSPTVDTSLAVGDKDSCPDEINVC
jgi:hypothetical protein